jgi:hypothetical protein
MVPKSNCVLLTLVYKKASGLAAVDFSRLRWSLSTLDRDHDLAHLPIGLHVLVGVSNGF